MLARSNPDLMFVTLFFAVWDPAQQSLRWINAGHNPPLLIRADGRVEYLKKLGGPALGPFKGQRYTENESHFSAGDRLPSTRTASPRRPRRMALSSARNAWKKYWSPVGATPWPASAMTCWQRSVPGKARAGVLTISPYCWRAPSVRQEHWNCTLTLRISKWSSMRFGISQRKVRLTRLFPKNRPRRLRSRHQHHHPCTRFGSEQTFPRFLWLHEPITRHPLRGRRTDVRPARIDPGRPHGSACPAPDSYGLGLGADPKCMRRCSHGAHCQHQHPYPRSAPGT